MCAGCGGTSAVPLFKVVARKTKTIPSLPVRPPVADCMPAWLWSLCPLLSFPRIHKVPIQVRLGSPLSSATNFPGAGLPCWAKGAGGAFRATMHRWEEEGFVPPDFNRDSRSRTQPCLAGSFTQDPETRLIRECRTPIWGSALCRSSPFHGRERFSVIPERPNRPTSLVR